MDKKIRIIISGGGTGGHIFPAISIANALKAALPEAEILFVGADGRMEMEKVPAAGYPIKGLPIQGFIRSLSFKNFKVLANAIKSLRLAKKIIQDFQPQIAIGVGGYASGPVLWEAAKLGIPTLIQEQNSYAGLTNKILAKKAKTICVAYDEMDRFFPKESIVLTGNPVRQNLVGNQPKDPAAYAHFGLDPEKKTILVVGGSLGARTINQSMLQGLELLTKAHNNHIQVIWQTGKFYYKELQKTTSAFNMENIVLTDFVSRMDYAYNIADLVISRAGASSISELSLLQKACILVPSPNVAEDHQTKNAMALVQHHAAVMITDAEAKSSLVQKAISLISNANQMSELQENIAYFARPNAARTIAEKACELMGVTPLPVPAKDSTKAKVAKAKVAKAKKNSKKQYYFLGIGGIGMSAIARFLKQQGYKVGGYDLTKTELTETLENEGIEIHYKDNISLIPVHFMDRKTTTVIYTPAIPEDMSERQFFEQAKFKMLKRSQALGELTAGKDALCVAGTHGKTTTSTLLAHLLQQRPQGVNAFLGGISKNYNSNLLSAEKSAETVVEADEFDRSFLRLTPKMAIVTALDPDHLDIYGTYEELQKAFSQFTSLIVDGGALVMKKGIALTPQVTDAVKVYTYSAKEKADFYAENIQISNGQLFFDFVSPKGKIEQVELGVPIWINVENAVAAMAVAQLNGLSDELIKQGVASFQGSARRFDVQVKNDKKVYIDDYAHHPAEIEACIQSVRQLYPDKKICGIFQPHLYTRTRDFATEFAQSLSHLDDVILLDIYPARELPIKGVNAQLISKQIKGCKKTICHKKEDIVEELQKHEFDVLLTIGAGNIGFLVPTIKTYVESISK